LPSMMAIPLRPEQYFVSSIGDRYVTSHYMRSRTFVDQKSNMVAYDIHPQWKQVIERGDFPSNLVSTHGIAYGIDKVRNEVCVVVNNHSFGRGLAYLLRSWNLIVTVPDTLVSRVQAYLDKLGCEYAHSTYFNAPRSAFSMGDMEVAQLVKLSFDGIEIVESRLGRVNDARLRE
jgi:hypothetical protein